MEVEVVTRWDMRQGILTTEAMLSKKPSMKRQLLETPFSTVLAELRLLLWRQRHFYPLHSQ